MNPVTRVLVWLAGLALALTIVGILFAALAANSSARQLEEYKQALRQRGEILDIASFIPDVSPEDEKRARQLIAECDSLEAKVKDGSLKAIVGRRNGPDAGTTLVMHRQAFPLPLAANPTTTALSWEKLTTRLQSLSPELDRIRSASTAGALEIHPDYRQGFTMPLVGGTGVLKASQYLGSASLLSLRKDEIAPAIINVKAQLAMARMMQRQPILISQLIAISTVSMAQATTWEILQNSACVLLHFSDPASKFLPLFKTTSGPSLLSELPNVWPQAQATADIYIWGIFFRYTDEKNFITAYQKLIEAAQTVNAGNSWIAVVKAGGQVEQDLERQNTSTLPITRTSAAVITPALSKMIGTQALTNLTIAAIALKRYQLDHAIFPDSLDALIPDHLSKIPSDPFDGKPLRYRLLDPANFLLYSVGTDGADDGGNPARPTKNRDPLNGKDIVWPKPAPEEPSSAGPKNESPAS